MLEGGETLLLSEVAEPPAQMIDSLTTLFKTIKPVKRAFLCSIKESADEKPVLLIGIEADGDIDEIIQRREAWQPTPCRAMSRLISVR